MQLSIRTRKEQDNNSNLQNARPHRLRKSPRSNPPIHLPPRNPRRHTLPAVHDRILAPQSRKRVLYRRRARRLNRLSLRSRFRSHQRPVRIIPIIINENKASVIKCHQALSICGRGGYVPLFSTLPTTRSRNVIVEREGGECKGSKLMIEQQNILHPPPPQPTPHNLCLRRLVLPQNTVRRGLRALPVAHARKTRSYRRPREHTSNLHESAVCAERPGHDDDAVLRGEGEGREGG